VIDLRFFLAAFWPNEQKNEENEKDKRAPADDKGKINSRLRRRGNDWRRWNRPLRRFVRRLDPGRFDNQLGRRAAVRASGMVCRIINSPTIATNSFRTHGGVVAGAGEAAAPGGCKGGAAEPNGYSGPGAGC